VYWWCASRGSPNSGINSIHPFREIRDEIELKIKDWLEHPEEELAKLRAERQREREERLRAAQRARELRTELEVVPDPSSYPYSPNSEKKNSRNFPC
jgi:hypothetical protein